MTFKPSAATWFETYTPRNLTVYAIEALAQTGNVELTHDALSVNIQDADHIRSLIQKYTQLAARFEDEMPDKVSPAQTHEETPEHLAEEAYKTLRQWCANLLRLKRKISYIKKEIEELDLIRQLLLAIPDHEIDFAGIERQSHVLYKKLFVCPPGQFSHPSGKEMFVEVFSAVQKDFVFALGTPEHAETVEAAAVLTGCKAIEIPVELEISSGNLLDTVKQKMADFRAQLVELDNQLAGHRQNSSVKESIVTIRLLQWYLANSSASPGDHELCHLIGWTSVTSANELERALEKEV